MTNARGVLFIILALLGSIAHGQDFFFSQFYNSPLTLNPSLTGLSVGDYRLNLNYRNHQRGIVPYTTYAAAFDSKILRSLTNDNTLAAGVIYLNDGYADGVVNNLTMAFSGAYHQVIGASKKHFFSGGFQAGLLQRKLDESKLSFANQWSIVNGYDPSVAHGVNIGGENVNSFDVNAGLLWYHFLSDYSSVFAGLTAAHIFAPKESFLGVDNRLSRRLLFHAGSRVPLNESMFIVPNIIYNSQNKISQATIGSIFEYRLSEDMAVKSGLWYRNSDKTGIVLFGMDLFSFQFGLSYDFYSSIQQVSNSGNSFELSLSYSPNVKPIVKLKPNPGTRF